jgi:hypothetical protein
MVPLGRARAAPVRASQGLIFLHQPASSPVSLLGVLPPP